MIDCESVREELSAYIDNELPLSWRQKIEQHLQLCKECYDEYFTLQTTVAIMRSLREIEPPPGLKEKIKERLIVEEKQGICQKILRRPWHSLGAAAAGLLLLIGSWNFLFDGGLAKIHTEIAKQDMVEMQYFAEDSAEQDSSTNAEALKFSLKQNEEAEEQAIDMDVNPSDTVMMAIPDNTGDNVDTDHHQGAKEEPQDFEVAVTFLPSEPEVEDRAESEQAPDEPVSRVMILQGDMPPKDISSDEKGLTIEVGIKTENSVVSQKAIESIAGRYGLEITSTRENGLITIEILAPLNLQKNIMEQLREIGFVANEAVSDPELDQKISDLITAQDELLQQQSELRALIASGKTAEEIEVWQEELARVKAQTEEVQKELSKLDRELSPSSIKITLME